MSTITIDPSVLKAAAVESMQIMAHGDPADFERVIHPEFFNHEASDEPPESRGRGPRSAYATALWLRHAFAPLSFEVHEVVAEGDLVVVHNTMRGRHVGDFVSYTADATVDRVFPATGREFASTQTHWLRMADGMLVEHWANRDDMATALQCGWIPPTPGFLLRSVLATRRERRRQSRP
jgi:predicted ester cyclase